MADVDYVYADLSRAGLGNLLFPWARAVIAADSLQVPMLPPKWLKARLGPYLRRDLDKRAYWKLFTPPPALAWVRRALLLSTATLISEAGDVVRSRGNERVLVIDSMAPMFGPIAGHHERIATQLRRTAKPGVLTRPGYGAFVALHVRLGDFVPAASDTASGTANVSTPISWFVDSVVWLRTRGWDGPIMVFSDGIDEQLSDVLRVPGVKRYPSRNALDDMLQMSAARLVIGSGSSFGVWAAYLGDVPIAVEAGRNPFGRSYRRIAEVARWSDDPPRPLVEALAESAP